MSKQEMLVLSTKDRDRLKVLHEVKRKHLTQRAAAQQLGVSDRWVRELLRRVKKEGGRRPGRGASGAGAGVEPAPAGKRAHQNAEAGAGKVPRLRAHAGLRVP